MKNIILLRLLFLALLSIATGCTQDRFFQDMDNNQLKVSAFYASENTYLTRSDSSATERITTRDTLYVNDEVYLATRVENRMTSGLFAAIDTTTVTRGTPIDKSESFATMNLVMFDTGTADFNGSTSAATDLFTVTASKGDFVLDKSYPWTAGTTNKHTFIAFAPKTGSNGVILSSDQKKLTYTASVTVTDQPDLCLSDISKNLNMVNTVGSNNHNQRFSMVHALTAIGFEAAGYDLRITKVTLKGVSTSGTLDLTTRAWSSLGGAATREAGIKSVWLMSDYGSQMTDITNANGYLMMIPQTLTNQELVMEYEGRTGQSGGSYTIKLKDVGTTWTAGKKIIYQLRLKSKPVVENNALSIADPRAGYTSLAPLSIAASSDDNLTFSWSESWLRVHRGNPGYINPQSGASSGWSTGVNNWQGIYFFATADNPSSAAARTATVTVSGKKSGRRTFTITQEKMVSLALSASGPGEPIPLTGKTYTIGVTSNTTWLGKEQTGATLSPASGNGNNSSVRVVVPVCSSWKDTQVKIAVATTNTSGPILTRTWSGTQTGVPLTVSTANVDINDYRTGYVSTSAPVIDAAADDELTFTWNESWLKVYSGNRTNTVNAASTGSGSGFKATASQWKSLFFFTSNDNPEAVSRVATVTVRSKSGATKIFTVSQARLAFSVSGTPYIDCTAGYTSTKFNFTVAPNDLIVVSTETVEICPVIVETPADNVYVGTNNLSTSVTVQGKDLHKVRFVSKKANDDSYNEKSAVVTFSSSKSGASSVIRVYQTKGWRIDRPESITLPFYTNSSSNEAGIYIIINIIESNLFETNDKPVTSSVSTSAENKLSTNGWFDKNWVRITKASATERSILFYKRNIHPWERKGTITFEVRYKNSTQRVTIPVTQQAADHWYIYNYVNNQPTSASPLYLVARQEIGTYYWGEEWRCSNNWGSGWKLPSQDEFKNIVSQMKSNLLYRPGHWAFYTDASRVPFRDIVGHAVWYWTRESGKTALQRYSIRYSSETFTTKTVGSAKGFNLSYRCIKHY